MNKTSLAQAVDLLAKLKKLQKFSTHLIHNESVDYEIKSKSFIDSANAAVDYSKFLTSLSLKMSNSKGTDTYDEHVFNKITVYEKALDPLL